MAAKSKRLVYRLLFYGSAALLAVVLILWLLGRWGVPLKAPCPPLHHDTMNAVTAAKVILDEGWWPHTPRLSAPHGLNLAAFPANGNLDYLVMRIAAFFVKNPIEVTNLTWFIAILLTALTAIWAFLRLGISRPTAYVTGLLYAFLPHLYFRTTAHIMLTYYLVPVVSAFCILVLAGKFQELEKHHKVLLFFGCFLVGFSYIYNAVFSLFFLVFTGAACLFLRDKKKKLKTVVIASLLLIAAIFFNLLPTMLAYRADPGTKEKMTSFKTVASADIYALRLRNLIVPVPHHFLPPLARVSEEVERSNFPLRNEAAWSNLGTLGTVGFLFLFIFALGKVLNFHHPGFANRKIAGAAALTAAALLLAAYGSFGSLINMISPQIRAYNRISVFIAFLSFFAAAFLVDAALRRFSSLRHARVFIPLLLACLLVFGALDQRPGNFKPVSRTAAADFDSPKELVTELEKELPGGAMVFNLPYNCFPNTLSILDMPAQADVIPYLHSRHLRWSCMPLSRKAETWQKWVVQLPAGELAAALCLAEFSGAWIDCRAYKDRGRRLIKKLSALAGDRHIYSRDQRYCFVFLDRAAEKIKTQLTAKQKLFYIKKFHTPHMYRWGRAIDFSNDGDNEGHLVRGWHRQEPHGRWTGKKAVLKFCVFPPKSDIQFILVGLPISSYGNYGKRKQSLEILVNHSLLQKFPLNPGKQTIRVTIPRADIPASNEFTVTLNLPNAVEPSVPRAPAAPRTLGIFINSITLNPL